MEKLGAELSHALRSRGLVPEDVPLESDTPLVSSGLIDSFSLVEVLQLLEQLSGCHLPSGQVSPQDLDTIDSMLALLRRHGLVHG